jgi:hypothetical protein
MALPYTFAALGAPPNPPVPMSALDQNFAALGITTITPVTATGSNAIQLTQSVGAPGAAVTQYNNEQIFSFVAASTSTGLVTAQVQTFGFKNVYLDAAGTTQASTGAITAGTYYQLKYWSAFNSGVGGFQIISPAQAVVTLNGTSLFANVLSYGADPTGAAASDTAFQNAINANTRVYVPPGTYKFVTGVVLRTGSYIWGDGPSSAIINIAASIAAFSFVNSSNTEAKITIESLGFNGVSAGTTAISLTYCETTLIQNVRFSGVTFNVTIDRGRWHTISNCNSEGNTSYPSGQLHIYSSTDTDYCFFPVVFNYNVNCAVFDTGIVQGSLSPAIYTRRTIMARLINCNIDHFDYGTPGVFILVENDTQGMKIIGGSSFGATYGILFQTGSGVAVGPSFTDIISHDVDFYYNAAIQISP